MEGLVQKFVVEDASKASPIMPAHVALVHPDGSPVAFPRAAKNPGEKPTVAKLVEALVEAGLMEAPASVDEAENAEAEAAEKAEAAADGKAGAAEAENAEAVATNEAEAAEAE